MGFNFKTFFRSKRRNLARTNGVLIIVILVLIAFSILNRYFFTAANMFSLLRVMSTLAILAMGQLLVIVSGEIDLSVGSIFGLGAMLTGVLWISGVPVYFALLIALLMGVVSGMITAWLVTYVRVPSFVATLGMMNLLSGITLLISNSRSISPAYILQDLPGSHVKELKLFNGLAGLKLPFGIPMQVVWMIILAIIMGILYNRFLFGFRLRAIGGNPEAAKLMKLPVTKYKFLVFIICGLFASLGGILDLSFIGTADPSGGGTLTFPVFAAVIIGGASLSGGRGSVAGTLIAAFLLVVLQNGLSLVGVGAFVQLLFVGVVTIGAVALDSVSKRKANPLGEGI